MGREALLAARGVSKSYGGRAVLRDVSLEVASGAVLGLVGASGSGKSTLARCLALFESPDAGEILFEGRPLVARARPAIQLILQQPAAALNPRFTAEEIVSEPLEIQGIGTRAQRRERAREMMAMVGLERAAAGRRALEFSGGERQRLAIARALAVEPKVLILDESFSGLDAGVGATVIGLIDDARRRGLACIVVSHDVAMVAQWVEEIAVMDDGAIVEQGPVARVAAEPRHERTRQLWEASAALALPL